MNKKQLLLISDLVGYGKVATTAMLPILSYFGIPTCSLPTMLISNPFEYGDFHLLDTTDYIRGVFPVWKKMGFRFDAIATGYVVSQRQADLVSHFCQDMSAQGAMIFVDPVMGDEGQLYNGVEKDIIRNMREMISVADICYPNYTEACLLTGRSYHAEGVTRDEARSLADHIRKIGSKSVLITSIPVDGQPSVFGYNHETDEDFCLPYNEIPVHFPGTGDIFSAILIGHILNGDKLQESTQAAMDGVWRLIDKNKDQEDKNRGIPLEQNLAELR
ncbi:pyridoxamine kinase [Prevotella sp. AGR2160]|uniref:pyridoxamine kinase n=1 Tax=Prevotella sp. AGR2160 TaxID=1280674 RepID=UPI000400C122|nr:pyridoxamine kinase [Prevotella sp. AGR2160]